MSTADEHEVLITPRLPAQAMHALADLVAAGHGMTGALAALPRHTLSSRTVRALDREIARLETGDSPLDVVLERLGLEITAVTLRAARSHGQDLEASLRADAGARSSTAELVTKTRRRIAMVALPLFVLAIVVAFAVFVYVPRTIEQLTTNMPTDWKLPPALVQFERFRDLWLTVGGSLLLVFCSLFLIWGGLLGRHGWRPFLHSLRLQLPFLRAHAIHTSSARLLEALAHEQKAGIPANDTLRRLGRRESVPELRAALELATARLDAGDPWELSLRGTLLATPVFSDLAALAGHGARPIQGWQWAAAQSRERALTALRRAIVAVATVILVPSFLYLMVLMHAAAVTATIAQIDSVNQQIELLSDEIEKMIPTEP